GRDARRRSRSLGRGRLHLVARDALGASASRAGADAAGPGANRRRTASGFDGARLELLPRIEQALRVEEALQLAVQLDGTRAPLPFQPAALRPADAVFTGDRTAESDRQGEKLLGAGGSAVELRLVGRVDDEVCMDVPVTRVAPAAGLEVVTPPHLDGLLHRLPPPARRPADAL